MPELFIVEFAPAAGGRDNGRLTSQRSTRPDGLANATRMEAP